MSGVHGSNSRNRVRLAVLASATILSLLLGATGGSAVAGDHAQPARSTQLDSRLAQIVDAFRQQGTQAATETADRLDIDAEGNAVRVIVEARPGLRRGATASARSLGAKIEGTYQDLIQALVPIASLEPLARVSAVEFVRPPLRPVPMVTGEGVPLINANGWHAQGISGAGVKVAILDLGFQGYESLLGTELPDTVTVMSFRADGDIGGGTPGTSHGTAVAEIVHEVAPGAEMYLVNFDTEVELASASAWLTGQGVELINASWGYFVSGPGDGTGIVNDVVSTSTAGGTLWSVAAANHAQKHWSGPFLDTDNDLFHEFQNTPFQDEGNQIIGAFFGLALPNDEIVAELKWDDPFGAACQDYDLYLKRTDDITGEPITVASSENIQNDGTDCVPGADPIESLSHTVAVADTYHLVIKESVTTRDAFLDLYSLINDIEYVVSANSLGQPADNPDALTVGAVYWIIPDSIEIFSSRGPTTDGRIKPDIVAPDGVSNATLGSFFGTSAASPHVTGAAALVRQLLPCYTPAELKAHLEAEAVDLGDPGKDNTFGSGRLLLGAPPLDTDADGLGDDCDLDDDNDGWTDIQEEGDPPGTGLFIGTGAKKACAFTSTADDEADDGLPVDFNDDRVVDISDIGAEAARFGAASGDPAYFPRFDLNLDGAIDITDMGFVAGRFGQSC